MVLRQDYELTQWLGGTEPTDEQREQIERAVAMIETRYPVPAEVADALRGYLFADVMADREQALSGAVQVILGDSTPDELAEAWLAAVRTAAEAHAEMTGAIIAASATTSERALADRLGVARDTVRKALGK